VLTETFEKFGNQAFWEPVAVHSDHQWCRMALRVAGGDSTTQDGVDHVVEAVL
jgi:hypothetical protein